MGIKPGEGLNTLTLVGAEELIIGLKFLFKKIDIHQLALCIEF
jgi:hypothetical protein